MHPIPVQLPKLIAYGNSIIGRLGELRRLEISELPGGYGSPKPYRIDLVFRVSDDNFESVPVVQKYISAAEAWVMRALCEIPAAAALPQVIDLFAAVQIRGLCRELAGNPII